MKRSRNTRQRLDPQQSSIAIVGSGLAGLSTAISLEQAGFTNVAIYERDESLESRTAGYGLTLTYHPTGILQKLGVLEQVAEADCPSRCHYLFQSNGELQGYFGNAFSGTSDSARGTGQRGNLRVPRQTIRSILMDRLKHTKIHWGHKLVGMESILVKNKDDDDDDDDGGDDTEQVRMVFEINNEGIGSGGSTSGPNGDVLTATGEKQQQQQQRQQVVTVQTDLVVAADGVRSSVIRNWLPAAPLPRSVDVRLIVGLTANNFTHPLLAQRGFYTLSSGGNGGDGSANTNRGRRLFVMPFSGNSLLHPDEPVRYMWQLSFWCQPETETESPSKWLTTAEKLRQQALDICRDWHEPVQAMIGATPAESIWSTVLHDSDPVGLQQRLSKHPCQRVILTGDALHAMTVFKGQGANQALQDGPVVAKWLLQSKLHSAVAGCMREMVQRTAPVVQASRQAAEYWHSSPVVSKATTTDNGDTTANSSSRQQEQEQQEEQHKFAGVRESCVSDLLRALRENKITAGTNNLDCRIQQVIDELQVSDTNANVNVNMSVAVDKDTDGSNNDDGVDMSLFFADALRAARTGSLNELRELSWRALPTSNKSSGNGSSKLALATVKCPAGTGRTCLHEAAAAGHVKTVHWLVTEAGCWRLLADQCDCDVQDGTGGRTALDLAKQHGQGAVEDLLRRMAIYYQ
jgi:2-polyprenyl-6-methoxyphenol hydroxylase-like FAD-dependent oxidoreductase